MFKPSTYLVITYFLTYAPIYNDLIYYRWVTQVKPQFNSVDLHPQLSHNRHPVDGSLSSSFTEAHFSPYVVT
jgi:hypothetical protein